MLAPAALPTQRQHERAALSNDVVAKLQKNIFDFRMWMNLCQHARKDRVERFEVEGQV